MGWRRRVGARVPGVVAVWALGALGALACASVKPAATPTAAAERHLFQVQVETLEQAQVVLGGPGPVRVIEFWATWCSACAESAPVLEAYMAEHPEVEQISVSIDDDVPYLRNYLKAHPRRGQALHFPGGNPAATLAGLKGVPLFVVLDREGRVVNSILGTGPELVDLLGGMVRLAQR